MPAGAVQHQHGNGTDRDASADLGQMFAHGFHVDRWHDHRGADAAGRTYRAEQISPGKPVITDRARAATTLGPNAGQTAVLANACFILEPDLDRLAAHPPGNRLAHQIAEVFVKASGASGAVLGCCGRTDIRRKSSLRSNRPTVWTSNVTPKLAAIRSHRSARRQRTTPSFARSGPASTHVANSDCCSADSDGGRPGCERSDRPSRPAALNRWVAGTTCLLPDRRSVDGALGIIQGPKSIAPSDTPSPADADAPGDPARPHP